MMNDEYKKKERHLLFIVHHWWDRSMDSERQEHPIDLKLRTKRFALRIIRLYSALPKYVLAQTLGKQVLRSGTSVGAQYREGLRSRSNAEIISKWEGALQELEETAYWLELIVESKLLPETRLADLMQECQELTAILVASVKTIKGRNHV
jgi:four helix bundle protein